MGCALPARNWSHVLESRRRIDGWVEPPDIAWAAILSSLQFNSSFCRLGRNHAVGEIGVHHGAYFVALAAAALPGERLFACDLFDSAGSHAEHGQSGRGDKEQLTRSLRDALEQPAFSLDSIALVRGSSLRLWDIGMAALPPFRFFSIDGGHSEVVGFSDLRWASARLAPGGIVALDDVANPNWLGVFRALRSFFHIYDRGYSRCAWRSPPIRASQCPFPTGRTHPPTHPRTHHATHAHTHIPCVFAQAAAIPPHEQEAVPHDAIAPRAVPPSDLHPPRRRGGAWYPRELASAPWAEPGAAGWAAGGVRCDAEAAQRGDGQAGGAPAVTRQVGAARPVAAAAAAAWRRAD